MSAIYCPPSTALGSPQALDQNPRELVPVLSTVPLKLHASAVARVASNIDLKCATHVFKKTEPLHASILLTSSCTWKQLNIYMSLESLEIYCNEISDEIYWISRVISHIISYPYIQ
jgi:hypothetical protein